MYTCIKVHEKMETVTLHIGMRFLLPPTEGIRNSNGKGGPREDNFQGGGVRFSRSFFPGTLKQELLFLLMILH